MSSLFLTNSRIQPPTIDSNTFESVEVKDIGRRSDSIFLGGLVLGRGTTLAFFHVIGTTPSRTDALIMAHTGSASQTDAARWTRTVDLQKYHPTSTGSPLGVTLLGSKPDSEVNQARFEKQNCSPVLDRVTTWGDLFGIKTRF